MYHAFCIATGSSYHFTMFIAITIEQVFYVQTANTILTCSSSVISSGIFVTKQIESHTCGTTVSVFTLTWGLSSTPLNSGKVQPCV